ncbi:unnamed protein product [Prorocentrum cordatum]|uniref:Uncharacterized protein n=1 Tax=Prorocentrum cordatum TaxID=2364126 RepID=A0ABN9T7L1_9DINO|nr:unnamed protein product [Polarella glacialis]
MQYGHLRDSRVLSSKLSLFIVMITFSAFPSRMNMPFLLHFTPLPRLGAPFKIPETTYNVFGVHYTSRTPSINGSHPLHLIFRVPPLFHKAAFGIHDGIGKLSTIFVILGSLFCSTLGIHDGTASLSAVFRAPGLVSRVQSPAKVIQDEQRAPSGRALMGHGQGSGSVSTALTDAPPTTIQVRPRRKPLPGHLGPASRCGSGDAERSAGTALQPPALPRPLQPATALPNLARLSRLPLLCAGRCPPCVGRAVAVLTPDALSAVEAALQQPQPFSGGAAHWRTLTLTGTNMSATYTLGRAAMLEIFKSFPAEKERMRQALEACRQAALAPEVGRQATSGRPGGGQDPGPASSRAGRDTPPPPRRQAAGTRCLPPTTPAHRTTATRRTTPRPPGAPGRSTPRGPPGTARRQRAGRAGGAPG